MLVSMSQQLVQFGASRALAVRRDMSKLPAFIPPEDMTQLAGVIKTSPDYLSRPRVQAFYPLVKLPNGKLWPDSTQGAYDEDRRIQNRFTVAQQKSLTLAVGRYLEHLELYYPDIYQRLSARREPKLKLAIIANQVPKFKTLKDRNHWHRDAGLLHVLDVTLTPSQLSGGLKLKSYPGNDVMVPENLLKNAPYVLTDETVGDAVCFRTSQYLHRCTDLKNPTPWSQNRTILLIGVPEKE